MDNFEYDSNLIASMIVTEADSANLNADEMAAMAWVVRNRLKPLKGESFTRGEGETDVEKIIRTDGAFLGVTDLKDRFDNPKKDHLNKYNMALDITKKVFKNKIKDPTNGAYFFNQSKGNGRTSIGSHYFRRDF